MSDTIRCPDCGHENPAGSENCESCNFPLPVPLVPPAVEKPPAPDKPPPIVIDRPLRPIRPRRPRPPASSQALTLWLIFGTFCALVVIFVAVKANVDRASQQVEGSNQEQQRRADELRAALAKDSTNVEIQIELGNLLYDTANWSEAIVAYRAALRHDSTRTAVLVDLGVCYYNLSDSKQAERYFRRALARDPHQPMALFNLGIVHERRKEYKQALGYFHRALQSAPPERMKEALLAAMERVQQATGATPPPLPEGR